MKKIFYLIIITSLISCTKSSMVLPNNYEAWLKDTIRILEKNEYYGYKRGIFVSQDSTTLEIVKTYDTIVNNKNIKSKEVLYAIELLRQNNKLPDSSFELNLEIKQMYSKPTIKRLKYDYSYEFSKFNIKYQDTLYQYTFIKGNMIDEKINY